MSDIITFVKLILYCVPFVATCLISKRMNFKQEHRYKQVFLPFIALIYCIVVVYFLTEISNTVLGFIYWLGTILGVVG